MRFSRRVESVSVRAAGREYRCLQLALAFTMCASCPLISAPQTRQARQRSWDKVVKIHFDPPLTQSVFTIPNTITVDVLAEVNPREVVLRSGPTGTEVAEFYGQIGRTDKKTSGPRGFTRFTFRIVSCEPISSRFEAIAVDAKNQKYMVSSEPFECKSPGARPIVTFAPAEDEVLHVDRPYTLRWQGGDPNYPMTIVLSCSFCTGPGITLAEKVPNNGSLAFIVTPALLREVDLTTKSPGVGRYYLALRQWDAGMNVVGGRRIFQSGPN